MAKKNRTAGTHGLPHICKACKSAFKREIGKEAKCPFCCSTEVALASLFSKDGLPNVKLTVATEQNSPQALTRLTEKQHSPLIIRKITKFGFPIYVAIITDDNLDDFDQTIIGVIKPRIAKWKGDSIQDHRNLTGVLVDALVERYGKTEGVAVIFSIDKTLISSLYGDFMTHPACRVELFGLLNMSCHV